MEEGTREREKREREKIVANPKTRKGMKIRNVLVLLFKQSIQS